MTAIARLSRVMSALEAEQARPPPCTLERALKARGLEPRPLPQALALAASTNTGSDAITTQGLAGAAGDALAGDNTLGLSAAMAMGSLTPLLASPLPGQAARMGVAGEGGVPASAGVKGAAGGVVGILARSLMLP